jgi:hypothetical protein
MPIPQGYQIEVTRPTGLIVAGVITLGGAYAYAVGSAAAGGFEKGEGWLAIPVVGPWKALASRDEVCAGLAEAEDFNQGKTIVNNCIDEVVKEGVRLTVIAFDGVMQIFGAGLLVAGLLSQEMHLVRNDLVPVTRPATRSRGWLVWPRTMGRAGWGLGVSGAF